MPNPFSKGWKYLMSSMDSKIEENADPKVQIQQAAEQAKKQHADITRQAATIIGNRNQLEMKLHRLSEQQQKLQDNARTAIQQSDAAASAGDQAKATELGNTAELFASQLVSVEQEIDETKQMYAAAVENAKQAEQQQKQSEMKLKEQMSQIDQLRAQADQAKMQETSAKTMDEMNAVANTDDVPTLDSVRAKIEQRYANAMGAQELAEGSMQGRMAEIEEAGADMRATSRLDQIRAEMKGSGELTGGAQGEITAGDKAKKDADATDSAEGNSGA